VLLLTLLTVAVTVRLHVPAMKDMPMKMHCTVRWYQLLRTLVDLQHGVRQAPLTLRSSALDEHVVGLEGQGGMLVRPQGGNPVGGAHLHHSGNLSTGGAL